MKFLDLFAGIGCWFNRSAILQKRKEEVMTVEKVRVEHTHHFEGDKYPKVVVSELFLGIPVRYKEVDNATGKELTVGQMVFCDDCQILGIVETK